MMRITMDVNPDNAHEALGLVNHFLKTYPDNHWSGNHPERHGVGYRMSDRCGGYNSYFVYGDEKHVRVKEST